MMIFLRPIFLLVLISALPAAAQTQLAESYEVRLELSVPDPPLRLPVGKKIIDLTPTKMPGMAGVDHLRGRLRLGPGTDDGLLVAVARKSRRKPYGLFFVDRDHDGTFSREESFVTRPEKSRGKIRAEVATTVRLELGRDGLSEDGLSRDEDHPIRLWIEVAERGQQPEALYVSPAGAHIARLDLSGFTYQVVLSDTDLDGDFDSGDLWTLEPVLAAWSSGWRRLDDFKWARGVAWKLELTGAHGRQGRLIRHDPGIAASEDAASRLPKNIDRLAPRAARPVVFATEVKAAMAEAVARGVPYFLSFGADWCAPCRRMEEDVYTAEAVAEAARGIVCIKVDGEDHPGLERRHRVEGYPTGILFAADGEEVARFRGYRGVVQMAAFFRQASR